MAALLKVNFSICSVSLAEARTEPSRARTEFAWAAGCLASRTYSQVFLCNVSLLRGLQSAN